MVERAIYWGGGKKIFLCVLKEYYCECGGGGGGLMPDFFTRDSKKIKEGGVIPKFLVCIQRILLRVWGGGGG